MNMERSADVASASTAALLVIDGDLRKKACRVDYGGMRVCTVAPIEGGWMSSADLWRPIRRIQ